MTISSEACLKQFIQDYSFRLTTGTLEGYQTAVVQLLAYSGKSFEQVKISCTGCTNNSDNTLQFMKMHVVG